MLTLDNKNILLECKKIADEISNQLAFAKYQQLIRFIKHNDISFYTTSNLEYDGAIIHIERCGRSIELDLKHGFILVNNRINYGTVKDIHFREHIPTAALVVLYNACEKLYYNNTVS